MSNFADYVDEAGITRLRAKGGGGGSMPVGVTAPVVVVSAFDTEITDSPPSGPATVDGYAVTTGDRVLLTAQTVGTDNGIWIANTSGDWTRASDWPDGATIQDGTLVGAGRDAGGYLQGSIWSLDGSVLVGTDSPTMRVAVSVISMGFQPYPNDFPTWSMQGQVGLPEVVFGGSLPTSDPGGGAIWNHNGVLTIGPA